ncbi:MAG: hypothetical protein HDT28_04990 [Clostridiales bacterium]|nr:hypothetical protein [Clostridiales bacterium]
MANRKIAQAGEKTRFSSTRQPANAGRKPKLYTIAKKGYNIGIDDFREVVAYVMQANKADLEKVIEDETTPVWVVNIARALHKDTGKGVTFTLRELVDHLFYRIPRDKGGEAADMDTSQLTDAELVQFYRLLDKMKKKDE